MSISSSSSNLDFSAQPKVTYVISAICLIVFLFQYFNNNAIEKHIETYCDSIHISQPHNTPSNTLEVNTSSCVEILSIYTFKQLHTSLANIIPLKHNNQILKHYEKYQLTAPDRISSKLMYNSDGFNVFKSIISPTAYFNILVFTVNLIFFFILSNILELFTRNTLKFTCLLISTQIITNFSYTIITLSKNAEAIPVYGLSGIIFGLIGLTMYLIPKAKINFTGNVANENTYLMPVSTIVFCYIAYFTVDLFFLSGTDIPTNFYPHVISGISGYLFGMFAFSHIRSESSDEVSAVIKQQGRALSTYEFPLKRTLAKITGYTKQQPKTHINIKANHAHKQDFPRIKAYMKSNEDSNAIVLMLENFTHHRSNVTIFEELFHEMATWGSSRALMCMGRTCISLLLEQRLYKRALTITEICQNISNNFVLADHAEVLLLAWGLIELQEYKTAYQLIHDSEKRYGKYIDSARCQLLEAELLWQHLDMPDEARKIMNTILADAHYPYKNDAQALSERYA